MKKQFFLFLMIYSCVSTYAQISTSIESSTLFWGVMDSVKINPDSSVLSWNNGIVGGTSFEVYKGKPTLKRDGKGNRYINFVGTDGLRTTEGVAIGNVFFVMKLENASSFNTLISDATTSNGLYIQNFQPQTRISTQRTWFGDTLLEEQVIGLSMSKNISTSYQSDQSTIVKGLSTFPKQIYNIGGNAAFPGDLYELIITDTTISGDVIAEYLKYKYGTPLELGADITKTTSFCPTILKTVEDYKSYRWFTKTEELSKEATISLREGKVYLEAKDNFGYVWLDSIEVKIEVQELKAKTLVCLGSEVEITTGFGTGFTYEWRVNGVISPIVDSQYTESNYTTGDTISVEVVDQELCRISLGSTVIEVDSFSFEQEIIEASLICQPYRLQSKEEIDVSNIWLKSGDTISNDLSTTINETGIYVLKSRSLLGCESIDSLELISFSGITPDIEILSEVDSCKENEIYFTINNKGSETLVEYVWLIDADTLSLESKLDYKSPDSTKHEIRVEVLAATGCSGMTEDVFEVSLPRVHKIVQQTAENCKESESEFRLSNYEEGELIWAISQGNTIEKKDTIETIKHIFEDQGSYKISVTQRDDLGCEEKYDTVIQVYPSILCQTDVIEKSTLFWGVMDSVKINPDSSVLSWNNGIVGETSFEVYKGKPTLKRDGKGNRYINFVGTDGLRTTEGVAIGNVFFVMKLENASSFNTLISDATTSNGLYIHSFLPQTRISTQRTWFGDTLLEEQVIGLSMSKNISTSYQSDQSTIVKGLSTFPKQIYNIGGNAAFPGDLYELIITDTTISGDVIAEYLKYKYGTPLDLGADITKTTSFCPTILKTVEDYKSYRWFTKTEELSKEATISLREGKVYLEAKDNFGYVWLDSIEVKIEVQELKAKTLVCLGSEVEITTGFGTGFTYEWRVNGEISPIVDSQYIESNYTTGDTISVEVVDQELCRISLGSTVIEVDSFSYKQEIIEASLICQPYRLQSKQEIDVSNIWFKSGDTISNNLSTTINETGVYVLKSRSILGCESIDSLELISFSGITPDIEIISEVDSCKENEIYFTINNKGSETLVEYVWQIDADTLSRQSELAYRSLDSNQHDIRLGVFTATGCYGIAEGVFEVSLPRVHKIVQGTAQNCEESESEFSLLNYEKGELYWSISQGNTIEKRDTIEKVNHIFEDQGSYQISVTQKDDLGCEEKYDTVIQVSPSILCQTEEIEKATLFWGVMDSVKINPDSSVLCWKNSLVGGTSFDAYKGKPTLKIDEKGKRYINFVGTDGLKTADSLSIGNVFFVMKLENASSFNTLISDATTSNGLYIQNFQPQTRISTQRTSFGDTLLKEQVIGFSMTKDISTSYQSDQSTIVKGLSTFPNQIYNVGGNAAFPGDLYELIITDTTISGDVIAEYLKYKYGTPLDLGADITKTTSFCPTELKTKDDYKSYRWFEIVGGDTIDLSDEGAINITEGKVYLEAKDNFGYVWLDSIEVNIESQELEAKTFVCLGSEVEITTGFGTGFTYEWRVNGVISPIVDSQYTESNYTTGDTISVEVVDQELCRISLGSTVIEVDSFSFEQEIIEASLICQPYRLQSKEEIDVSNIWLKSGDTISNDLSTTINETGVYVLKSRSILGCESIDSLELASFSGITPDIEIISEVDSCIENEIYFTIKNKGSETLVEYAWLIDADTLSRQSELAYRSLDSNQHDIRLGVFTATGCYGIAEGVFEVSLPRVHKIVQETAQNCKESESEFSLLNYEKGELYWSISHGNTIEKRDTIEKVNHIFEDQGSYQISVTQRDDLGCEEKYDTVIQVSPSILCQTDVIEKSTIFWGVMDSVDIKADSSVLSWNNKVSGISLVNKVQASQYKIDKFGDPYLQIDGYQGFITLDSIIPGNIFMVVDLALTSNFRNLIKDSDASEGLLISTNQIQARVSGSRTFYGDTSLRYQVLGYSLEEQGSYGYQSGTKLRLQGLSKFSKDLYTIGGSVQSPFQGKLYEVIITDTTISGDVIAEYLKYKYGSPLDLLDTLYKEYGFCETELETPNYYESYAWYVPNGNSLQLVSTSPTYKIDTGKVVLKVVDRFGYEWIDSTVVKYPFSEMDSVHFACAGDQLLIQNQLAGAYTYEWESANKVLSVEKDLKTNEYSDGQIIDLKVIDTLGCTYKFNFIQINIDSFALNTQMVVEDKYCSPAILRTNAGNIENASYKWLDKKNLEIGNDSIVSVVQDGYYLFQFKSANGCHATGGIDVVMTGKSPQVDFIKNADTSCVNELVEFQNKVIAPEGSMISSMKWTFGDGGSSLLENLSYKYVKSGNITIGLRATTTEGCASTIFKNHRVEALPLANFTNGLLCQNNEAQFVDRSVSNKIAFWEWSIEDSVFATTQNPYIQYYRSGFNAVKLTVTTNNGCANSIQKFVEFIESPQAEIISDLGCLKNFSNFKANDVSVTEYNWLIDGQRYFGAEVNHKFITTGKHQVKLEAVSKDGCNDTISSAIVIDSLPVINVSTNTLCKDLSIEIKNQGYSQNDSIIQTTWFNEQLGFYKGNKVRIAASKIQEYSFVIDAQNSKGCVSSSIIKFQSIEPQKTPLIIDEPFGDVPYVLGFENIKNDHVQYQWYLNDTLISDQYYLLDTIKEYGTYNLELVVNDRGCKSASNQIIEVVQVLIKANILNTNIDNRNGGKIYFDLKNSGTVTLKDALIKYYLDDLTLFDTIHSTIMPNEIENLNSSFDLSSNAGLSTICLEVVYKDTVISNRSCLALRDDVKVYVPIRDLSFMSQKIYIPESDIIQYQIITNEGKVIFDEQIIGNEGFNVFEFDLEEIAQGMYYSKIIYRGEKYVYRFEIIK